MKKERAERFPLPDSIPERFMGVVYSMLEPFGMDKVPEVMHYVELLGQAVDRHVFESSHRGGGDKKANEDRRKFIAIFKHRHLHHMDLEYTRQVTDVDGKMILQVSKKISELGFTADEFLQWCFEVFLEENTKFNPPTIRFVCSQFVVDKFIYDNRERAKKKKLEEQAKTEALEVIGRGRVVLRTLRDSGRKKELDGLVDSLKKYSNGCIMLSELRKNIELLEKSIQEALPPDGGTNGNEHGCAQDV